MFHQDYELRSYFKSTWVATNITTMTFTEEDERELFDRLFHYISGNNTKRKFSNNQYKHMHVKGV